MARSVGKLAANWDGLMNYLHEVYDAEVNGRYILRERLIVAATKKANAEI